MYSRRWPSANISKGKKKEMLKQIPCAENPTLQTLQGHITLQLSHKTLQSDSKFHTSALYSQGGLLLPLVHEPRDRTNMIHLPAATDSKDYSTRSTLTEAQSVIFIYCLSMSSLDVLLHLHSHYNCSLDINRTGFCCSQVI